MGHGKELPWCKVGWWWWWWWPIPFQKCWRPWRSADYRRLQNISQAYFATIWCSALCMAKSDWNQVETIQYDPKQDQHRKQPKFGCIFPLSERFELSGPHLFVFFAGFRLFELKLQNIISHSEITQLDNWQHPPNCIPNPLRFCGFEYTINTPIQRHNSTNESNGPCAHMRACMNKLIHTHSNTNTQTHTQEHSHILFSSITNSLIHGHFMRASSQWQIELCSSEIAVPDCFLNPNGSSHFHVFK